jgi:hypothetical protein
LTFQDEILILGRGILSLRKEQFIHEHVVRSGKNKMKLTDDFRLRLRVLVSSQFRMPVFLNETLWHATNSGKDESHFLLP